MILYNALQISPTGAGVARYTLELARELAGLRQDIVFAVQEHSAHLLDVLAERLLKLPNFRTRLRRIVVEHLSIPERARHCGLAHYPDFVWPPVAPWPGVTTCHDLAFLRMPETFTLTQRIWKRHEARRAASLARRVICVSESTAQDVRDLLNVPPERIRMVHSGIRPYAGEPARPDGAPDGPFILCVATLEPRKNYVRLIEAFARLKADGAPHKLVIAGLRGWKWRPILRAARRRAVAGHVLFLGHCDDAHLKWLYSRADVFAYVPLWEGFGFPPLEAMACGAPVVTSDVSSLPEVCGDAARYVNPLSVESIAEGIRSSLEDTALRARLSQAGKARAAQFTWQRTAQVVSAIYDEAIGG